MLSIRTISCVTKRVHLSHYASVRHSSDWTSNYGSNYGSNSNSNYGSNSNSNYGSNTARPNYGSSYGMKAHMDVPPVVPLSLRFSPSRTPKEVADWRAENAITVTGAECPDPFMTFAETPFNDRVKSALSAAYQQPLAVQSQGWSVVMTGHNMVGCADTGSGKTVAFLLPLFEHIQLQPPMVRGRGPYALVLAPTRELAQQIEAEANKFARSYGINVACLFGGQGNRGQQLRQLERSPALVIATPGRLLDIINVGNTNLSAVSFVVLDEADRMMDMGFGESVRELMNLCNPIRQICMWTATWPKNVDSLARAYIPQYIKVNVGSLELTANPNVKQLIEPISREGKVDRLLQILRENLEAKILIFSATKVGCETLGRTMWQRGFTEIATLHGDKDQNQRNNILADFKTKTLKCVIATDVAARGLDVNNIDLVVNYDFPNDIESYIHRIGRTARAGKKGTAITFLTEEHFHLVDELIGVLRAAKQPVPPELRSILDRSDEIRMAKQRAGRRTGGGGGGGNKNPYGASLAGSSNYGFGSGGQGGRGNSKPAADFDWGFDFGSDTGRKKKNDDDLW